ncbi:MAG: DUF669 domain-containing protein [Pseudomonadales bacterium]|nr:DUF669 domain-containing protein [Pseudomonadales bacterium]
MANLNGFNAAEIQPTATFDVLPAGKYVAVISESEMRATQKGDGSYLQLEFTITDGQYEGRKLWARLCINHPNELTQKIARQDLSAVCHAVGILQPGDSSELHHIPMQITVKCKKRHHSDEMDNEIKGYVSAPGSSVQGSSGSVSGVTPASQPAPWA